jgi:hypothetical protein
MKPSQFKQVLNKLNSKLKTTERGFLNTIANVTGFIKRKSSKLCGWDFFQLMTAEHFNDAAISLQGLCDSLRAINPKADLSAQALHQRMNNTNAVSFMEKAFAAIYKKSLMPVIDKVSPSVFDSFNRVFLQDSTQIELNEHLAEDFQGSGGSASKSAMKIDLVYELKQFIVQKLIVSEGTVPDQSRADMITDIVKKGDLVIRDLGYFVLDVFKKIADKKACYLSRYKSRTTVYLSKKEGSEPINLLELIKKNMEGNSADMAIFFREAEVTLPYGCL